MNVQEVITAVALMRSMMQSQSAKMMTFTDPKNKGYVQNALAV